MLSGLTLRGRCLLAAGVAASACAWVLDERDLLRVAVFLAALPLLAVALAGRARIGLNADRQITPARLPVGSQASVRIKLTGSGYLPVAGLLIEDGVPHALGGRPRFRLADVPRNNGAILEYTVQPQLRGIHHIGPLRARIGDPLGLCEFERELGGRTRLIARPRLVPLGGLPGGSGLGGGDEGSTRLRAGHGEDDAMVRQYHHGDDIRRVHWKSSARRDELMVRVEEKPWQGGVTVLLDRRSAAHRGSGAASSLEWAVSAAASIGVHLHARGREPYVVTEDGELLSASDSTGDTEHMLDALAAIRPSAQRDLVWEHDPGHGRELIAVLGATTATGVAELSRLRPQGTRSLALLLDVRAWSSDSSDSRLDLDLAARSLRAAGWIVATVDGPRASMASAWSQLCGDSDPGRGNGIAS